MTYYAKTVLGQTYEACICQGTTNTFTCTNRVLAFKSIKSKQTVTTLLLLKCRTTCSIRIYGQDAIHHKPREKQTYDKGKTANCPTSLHLKVVCKQSNTEYFPTTIDQEFLPCARSKIRFKAKESSYLTSETLTTLNN